MDAGIFSSEFEAVAGVAGASLSAGIARCLERFFRWGAAPTVDAYCDLFSPTGTLLDADMAAPISGPAIRDSITAVLELLPDFRFAPVGVVVDEPHAFVRAANRATLGERSLAWEAIYALTLEGDRIAAGRRYYDRAGLVTGTSAFGSVVSGAAVEAVPPVAGAARAGAVDLAVRSEAWNRRDSAALVAGFAGARLHMAGVGLPLDAPAAQHAALTAFLDRAEGLRVAPGAVARTPTATAIEWVGTVGVAPRRFAFVEIVDGLPPRRGWHLCFDTSGFQEGS